MVGQTTEGLLHAAPLLLGHVLAEKNNGVRQTSALPPSRYTRAERTLPLAGTLSEGTGKTPRSLMQKDWSPVSLGGLYKGAGFAGTSN